MVLNNVLMLGLMNPQKGLLTDSPDHVVTKYAHPRILVVEDEPMLAGMLEIAFRTWGYEVSVARNGQEGLDVLGTQSVNGILLDMHMPTMDGRTMLDELRWAGYKVPVWVMSGGSDVQALRQLLDEGAQGFFVKPFRLQSLKESFDQTFLSFES